MLLVLNVANLVVGGHVNPYIGRVLGGGTGRNSFEIRVRFLLYHGLWVLCGEVTESAALSEHMVARMCRSVSLNAGFEIGSTRKMAKNGPLFTCLPATGMLAGPILTKKSASIVREALCWRHWKMS